MRKPLKKIVTVYLPNKQIKAIQTTYFSSERSYFHDPEHVEDSGYFYPITSITLRPEKEYITRDKYLEGIRKNVTKT